MRLATTKEPAVKKPPAAKKLPVVPIKEGTAQASCCPLPRPVAAVPLEKEAAAVMPQTDKVYRAHSLNSEPKP